MERARQCVIRRGIVVLCNNERRRGAKADLGDVVSPGRLDKPPKAAADHRSGPDLIGKPEARLDHGVVRIEDLARLSVDTRTQLRSPRAERADRHEWKQ